MQKHTFQLSCESTVDMPYSYISGRGISVLFYTYVVDGEEFVDDMGRDPQALPRFYGLLKAGKMPITSQINTYAYEEYFRSLLKDGDVFHIAFGSGMTPSVNNAIQAAENLKAEFPDRRLIVVDSTCSSSGYGLMVDSAADLWDRGLSADELERWILAHREHIHHQFFSTDLKYFKRSGRVSGPAAAIASVLNICPMMRLNLAGRIIAYGKARGKKTAINGILTAMEQHAAGGREYNGRCYISHSNCIETAEETKRAIMERFPNIDGDIRIFDIGTIIAAHTGPGTVAVFFFGDLRIE